MAAPRVGLTGNQEAKHDKVPLRVYHGVLGHWHDRLKPCNILLLLLLLSNTYVFT